MSRWKQYKKHIPLHARVSFKFSIAITCNNVSFFTGADVTDHIPVDDNPVYITMKKIDLNKNSAYEAVTISGKPF